MKEACYVIVIVVHLLWLSFGYGQDPQFNQVLESLSRDTDTGSLTKAHDFIFSHRYDKPGMLVLLARKKLALAKYLEDATYQAKFCNLLGLLHRTIGQADSASKYFLRANDLYTRIGNVTKAYGSLYNLMNLYVMEMENPGKAYTYGIQVLRYAKQSQDSILLLPALNAMAQVYWKMDSNAKAKELIGWGLNLAEREGNYTEMGYLHQKMAHVLLDSPKDYDKALQHLQLALLYSDSSCYSIASITSLMGEVYARKGSVEEADEKLDVAEGLTSCFQSNDLLSDIYFRRYLAFANAGNYVNALEYFIKFDSVRSIVLNEKSIASINQYQALHEADKKEAAISALTRENRISILQRNLFVLVAVLLLAIATSAIVVYTNRIRTNKMLAEQRILQLEKEQEVMSLQSMLFAQEEERQRIARDLHDSIGALLSTAKLHLGNIEAEVKKLTEMGFLKNTEEMIDRASMEVRRVAHDMMPGVLMKLGLVEGIEDFFDRVRNTNFITVSFVHDNLPHRLDNAREVMLYRIVQELTSNTIKHANASEIKLMLKIVEGQLVLDYRDDGKGFAPSLMDDSHKFGLSGIKSRVNFLDGKISLDTAPGRGAHYTISVPLA